MQPTITVRPNPQKEGCEVKIALAGGTPGILVTVAITNNGGDKEIIRIRLDANGNGSTQWTIPSGWSAHNGADFDCMGWAGDTITIAEPDGACYAIPVDIQE